MSRSVIWKEFAKILQENVAPTFKVCITIHDVITKKTINVISIAWEPIIYIGSYVILSLR